MHSTGAVAAQCWSHWSNSEEIPHVQGQRRSPSKTVGGAKLRLPNPTPVRDAQRAQTYLVCTRTQRPHRDWDRTVFDYLLRRYESAVHCYRAGTLGAVDLGMASALLDEVAINTTTEPPELTHDCGNRLLQGTNLVCTRTQEKGAVTPQETDPTPIRELP